MSKRPLAMRNPDLCGLNVLVVGLGRSGLAAARLAADREARVVISDDKSERELGERLEQARGFGAEVRAGGNPPELAAMADLIVVSPGVRPDLPLLRRGRELELPIWGEIELAARFCRGKVIGVTGSNGKSTVTAMLGAILSRWGVPGGAGGNLDTPFAELLSRDADDAVFAIELSSFQLETAESMRPAVALILNLSPDHLDRYDSFDAYARAKARIFELQDRSGQAVLNADDTPCDRFRASVRGGLSWFSVRREVDRGAFLKGDRVTLRTDHGEESLLDVADLPLPGDHNTANALAASLASRLVGCPVGAIAEGLRSYRALPHRLEYVATVRGVAFYDDSKATNPASTGVALGSFEPGTVHLILGGRDKGADWSELVQLLARRAGRVLLVGESAGALRDRLQGVVPIADCDSVERAVAVGLENASAGHVVLLSPGCASFDQYANFEERGEDFKRAVLALSVGGGADA